MCFLGPLRGPAHDYPGPSPVNTLQILRYPTTTLTTTCTPVPQEDFKTVGFLSIIQLMRQTCIAAQGYALAAPQVGIQERFFVLINHPELGGLPNWPEAVADRPYPLVVCNPEVVEASEDLVDSKEGCLSIPRVFGHVKRHQSITVRFQDENGETGLFRATGLLATVFQHELDHCSGVLFIDKLNWFERGKAQKAMNKLRLKR